MDNTVDAKRAASRSGRAPSGMIPWRDEEDQDPIVLRNLNDMAFKTPSLHELLDQFQTTMLITRAEDTKELHARPMVIAGLEKSCLIWLLTSKDSAKVHEIEDRRHVHLTMQRENETYLSVDGHADIVEDREKVIQCWQPAFDRYFPKGKEDPNIALIAVTPEHAEYWTYAGSKDSGKVHPPQEYRHGTKPEQVAR